MENENKTITGESIIELKLPETVKKLKIDGRIYKFNVDSIELLRKIEGFGVEARKIAQRSDLKEEENIIDPKIVELSVYNGIPHLLIPVVTDPKKAAGALAWAVQEMDNRYNVFAQKGVRDLKGYNAMAEKEGIGIL